jgi:hypothetical protein
MNKYYVYLHRRESDNKVFYVGKGCGSRAKAKTRRSLRWKKVVSKHGFIVEIVFENLSEFDAYEIEKDVIKEMRYHYEDTIINVLDGGDGGLEYQKYNSSTEYHKRRVSETFSDRKIYNFVNKSGKKFIGTREEFCNFSGLTKSRIRPLFYKKPYETTGGWGIIRDGETFESTVSRLNVKVARKPRSNKHRKSSEKIEFFLAPDNTCLILPRFVFIKIFGKSARHLFRGHSYRGWRIMKGHNGNE